MQITEKFQKKLQADSGDEFHSPQEEGGVGEQEETDDKPACSPSRMKDKDRSKIPDKGVKGSGLGTVRLWVERVGFVIKKQPVQVVSQDSGSSCLQDRQPEVQFFTHSQML